jgi:hypothetical protein
MTEQTLEAVDSYIGVASKKSGEFLFSSRRDHDRPIMTRQYARLVCQWIASIGLDPSFFGTPHSERPRIDLKNRLRCVGLVLTLPVAYVTNPMVAAAKHWAN